MTYIRPLTTTVLTVFLILVMGLGNVAHALASECVGGHCIEHMATSVEAQHADHGLVAPGEDGQHEPDTSAHEGCNPFLCNVLALTTPAFETKSNQAAVVLALRATSLSTLNEPDNPDRPPNA
ncbi:hypothetical protein [uncultured Ruegeria sp.]|uniref:hypothetical protein n=1 Tax=uncultured Ruegeria sp. TaxID=259304 RepID=UPI00260191F1|nr:hypothetical protein [uncultured Ruegeria sp.]